ncbi:hypothetical protein FQA39_LY19164 [Lamprigera yunnana]|nr:hypothetical protein FQA39_LY19164 [Lamprigera yunnana]
MITFHEIEDLELKMNLSESFGVKAVNLYMKVSENLKRQHRLKESMEQKRIDVRIYDQSDQDAVPGNGGNA